MPAWSLQRKSNSSRSHTKRLLDLRAMEAFVEKTRIELAMSYLQSIPAPQRLPRRGDERTRTDVFSMPCWRPPDWTTSPLWAPARCAVVESPLQRWNAARAGGIEPTFLRCERSVLPLYDDPVAAGQEGIEPPPADLETAWPPWPLTRGAREGNRALLTGVTSQPPHQMRTRAFGAPGRTRAFIADLGDRSSIH